MQASLGLAEVAVVEGVGVHLHQKGQGVEGEKDLRRPRPAEQERPFHPKHEPHRLVYALDPDPCPFPAQDSGLTLHPSLDDQTQGGARDHDGVTQSHGHHVPRQ